MFIDITRLMNGRLPVYPGDPEFQHTAVFTVEQEGYQVSEIRFGSHFGTHIDAPRHFFKNGRCVHELPLERLQGRTQVVQVQGNIDASAVRALDKEANIFLFRTGGMFGITPEGAQALSERAVWLIGTDAMDIETSDAIGYPAHKTLLGNNIPILEGLNLEKAQEKTYRLICLPLYIEAVDACPVRAVLEEWHEARMEKG